MSERRRFSRISFHVDASLFQRGRYWSVNVIDISLNGVLVEEPAGWNGNTEQLFTLTIRLDRGTAKITMSLVLAHYEHGRIGFRCEEIDLESATRLRSLLASNIGDSSLVNRELSALLKSTST